jgi:CheY-like chemotaxis protein
MGDLPGIEDASTLGRGKISIMISECQAPSLLIRIQPSGQVQAEPFESSQPDLVAPSSRVLLEAMGGKLDVWHNPGEINLECSWSVPSSPLLLVIDDDPDFIELVRRFLANSTWKVSGVVDGESTREFLKTCLPDVILLDVILPREDGWELLLSLKTDPATQNIPVIVCSALNEPGLVHALGGAQALLKPISRASLLDALHPWAAPSQE